MNDLPEWVKRFNDQRLPEKYLKNDWNTLYPINTYVQSSVDDNPYEGRFKGNSTSTFPVKTSTMFSKNFAVLRSTPYGNSLTLEMAKAAIENEQLGRDEITDFLTVSFSSTDYVGHKFGVNAIETEDTYLRLDQDLAALFKYLDIKVGKGAYSVFLTADHGAANNPGFLTDNKIPAGYWPGGKILSDLNKQLENLYQAKNIVTGFNNSQVQLNYKLIDKDKLDKDAVRGSIVEYLQNVPAVSFVIDNLSVHHNGIPELLEKRIKNGFHFKRSGAITFVLEPGWYSSSKPDATGTSHGAWNPYDAHIPLLWMGWGIKHGASNRPVNMSDVAPTVAALLHIQEPNGNIGKPIEEVINFPLDTGL
jgi:predicted AlkP superfamily pyrophosphatase or phosphodiesterase